MKKKIGFFVMAGLVAAGSVAAIAAPTWQKVTAGTSGGVACSATFTSYKRFITPATATFYYQITGGGGGGGGGGSQTAAGKSGGDGTASYMSIDGSIKDSVPGSKGGAGGAAGANGLPGGAAVSTPVKSFTVGGGQVLEFRLGAGGGGGGGASVGNPGATDGAVANGSVGGAGGNPGAGVYCGLTSWSGGSAPTYILGGAGGKGGDSGVAGNAGGATNGSGGGAAGGAAGGGGGVGAVLTSCMSNNPGTPGYAGGGGGGGNGGSITVSYTAGSCWIQ